MTLHIKLYVKNEKMKIEEEKLLDFVKFSQRDIRKLVSTLEYFNFKDKEQPENNLSLDGLDKKKKN